MGTLILLESEVAGSFRMPSRKWVKKNPTKIFVALVQSEIATLAAKCRYVSDNLHSCPVPTSLQSDWTSISPSARFPAPSESWSTAAQGCTAIPCPTQSRDTHPEPDWASISPCRRPQRTGVQLPRARPQSHRPHGAQLSSAPV